MTAPSFAQRVRKGAKHLGEILGRRLHLVGDGGGHVAAGHGEAEAELLDGIGFDGADDLFRHTGRMACLSEEHVRKGERVEGLWAFCDKSPTGVGYADWFLAWHFRTPEERIRKRWWLRAATWSDLGDCLGTGDFDVIDEFMSCGSCGVIDDFPFHTAIRKRQALRRGKAALALLNPRPDSPFDGAAFLAAWKAVGDVAEETAA